MKRHRDRHCSARGPCGPYYARALLPPLPFGLRQRQPDLLAQLVDLRVAGELGGEPVHLAQPVPGAVGGVRAHRHQGQPRVPVRLFGVVGDEAGRGHRQEVEDLRPLPSVDPQRQGLLRVVLGVRGRARLVLGQGAVGQGLHAVQVLLLEGLHPARWRDVAPVGDEEVLRLSEGAAHGLALAHGCLCPGLDGVEHRPGARQHLARRSRTGRASSGRVRRRAGPGAPSGEPPGRAPPRRGAGHRPLGRHGRR